MPQPSPLWTQTPQTPEHRLTSVALFGMLLPGILLLSSTACYFVRPIRYLPILIALPSSSRFFPLALPFWHANHTVTLLNFLNKPKSSWCFVFAFTEMGQIYYNSHSTKLHLIFFKVWFKYQSWGGWCFPSSSLVGSTPVLPPTSSIPIIFRRTVLTV